MQDLKELFESAVLTDDTKNVIKEAFELAVEAKKTELEAEYATKLQEAESKISEELPSIIESAIADELAVIAEEVAHARTLEVQYAEKLTTFKESYATRMDEQLNILVAEAVAAEYEELKEDIELAKKHEFVMSMFETFKDTYEQLFGGVEVSVVDELKETKQELDQYKRKEKLAELLESLSGDKKLIAETILENVSTDKLESKFESIRGVLLAESVKDEKTPVVESAKTEEQPAGKVVLEEGFEQEPEKVEQPKISDEVSRQLEKSLKLAGRR